MFSSCTGTHGDGMREQEITQVFTPCMPPSLCVAHGQEGLLASSSVGLKYAHPVNKTFETLSRGSRYHVFAPVLKVNGLCFSDCVGLLAHATSSIRWLERVRTGKSRNLETICRCWGFLLFSTYKGFFEAHRVHREASSCTSLSQSFPSSWPSRWQLPGAQQHARQEQPAHAWDLCYVLLGLGWRALALWP